MITVSKMIAQPHEWSRGVKATAPTGSGSALSDTVTLTILQDVTILATGQIMSRRSSDMEGGADRFGSMYSSVTVAVTPREAEIAAQISAGLSPADVAHRLGVGEGTVRSHLKAVMHKCAVHSQTELAALISRFA